MQAILGWFAEQPDGTTVGTVDLARAIGYRRESVYRALLRMEDEGWAEWIEEPHGGLAAGHQRRWRCPRDLSSRRSYQEYVAQARSLRGEQ